MIKSEMIFGIFFTLLLVSMLALVFNIQPIKASGTIYIRADGSIDGTTCISTVDNITYTFTDNINDSIVVERDNIVVDGAGYTLQGTGAYYSEGIDLTYRSNVTIKNMEIKTFDSGIRLDESSNNTIEGNNITNNKSGIHLWISSNNNTIAENNITNNGRGINLIRASNNVLRNNSIANNTYNFWISGSSLSEFVNDVDSSNTVDGKPVYYWIDERDKAVPLDAGYVALVNCTNITVQNLNLTKNGQSILLAYTTNTTITKNNITNNLVGIYLYFSSNNNTIAENNITTNNGDGILLWNSPNNTVSGNNINLTNNSFGIRLIYSSNNTVSGNNITNNNYGINLYLSSNNTISGNNITKNEDGICFEWSSNNIIYHNNFISNIQQVSSTDSTNVWDGDWPSGGNYWSDYTGVDANMDGVGDDSYEIDSMNVDHYPLMGMFSDFPVKLEEETYHATTVCNSTISEFEFDQVNRIIRFNVTGEEGIGFCRVCIPHDLIEPPYTVTVDGYAPLYANYTLYDNGTHTWIYLTYQHSMHEVVIVPEFSSFVILPLFMTTTLLAVVYVEKRKRRES